MKLSLQIILLTIGISGCGGTPAPVRAAAYKSHACVGEDDVDESTLRGDRNLRLVVDWDFHFRGEVAVAQEDSCVFTKRLEGAPGFDVRRTVREFAMAASASSSVDVWFRIRWGCMTAHHRTSLRDSVTVFAEARDSSECTTVHAQLMFSQSEPESQDPLACAGPELSLVVRPCSEEDLFELPRRTPIVHQ